MYEAGSAESNTNRAHSLQVGRILAVSLARVREGKCHALRKRQHVNKRQVTIQTETVRLLMG